MPTASRTVWCRPASPDANGSAIQRWQALWSVATPCRPVVAMGHPDPHSESHLWGLKNGAASAPPRPPTPVGPPASAAWIRDSATGMAQRRSGRQMSARRKPLAASGVCARLVRVAFARRLRAPIQHAACRSGVQKRRAKAGEETDKPPSEQSISLLGSACTSGVCTRLAQAARESGSPKRLSKTARESGSQNRAHVRLCGL